MRSRGWTLPVAAWLAAAEAAVLIAVLAVRGAPGAAFYIALLTVKFPFCWFVTQRRPGAYLALLVWEIGGIVTALGARDAGVLLRLGEVAMATTVGGLLVASMPLFPTVTLPERS